MLQVLESYVLGVGGVVSCRGLRAGGSRVGHTFALPWSWLMSSPGGNKQWTASWTALELWARGLKLEPKLGAGGLRGPETWSRLGLFCPGPGGQAPSGLGGPWRARGQLGHLEALKLAPGT